ncbi:MAG: EF-hand domain-containing protein, partial [Flavobacteriales bacterium]|nr:EF-hand domain-containing protein [Flavobacteriales bacterium]
MAQKDTDKDGRISRAEFAAAHAGKDTMFPKIDTDGDGT